MNISNYRETFYNEKYISIEVEEECCREVLCERYHGQDDPECTFLEVLQKNSVFSSLIKLLSEGIPKEAPEDMREKVEYDLGQLFWILFKHEAQTIPEDKKEYFKNIVDKYCSIPDVQENIKKFGCNSFYHNFIVQEVFLRGCCGKEYFDFVLKSPHKYYYFDDSGSFKYIKYINEREIIYPKIVLNVSGSGVVNVFEVNELSMFYYYNKDTDEIVSISLIDLGDIASIFWVHSMIGSFTFDGDIPDAFSTVIECLTFEDILLAGAKPVKERIEILKQKCLDSNDNDEPLVESAFKDFQEFVGDDAYRSYYFLADEDYFGYLPHEEELWELAIQYIMQKDSLLYNLDANSNLSLLNGNKHRHLVLKGDLISKTKRVLPPIQTQTYTIDPEEEMERLNHPSYAEIMEDIISLKKQRIKELETFLVEVGYTDYAAIDFGLGEEPTEEMRAKYGKYEGELLSLYDDLEPYQEYEAQEKEQAHEDAFYRYLDEEPEEFNCSSETVPYEELGEFNYSSESENKPLTKVLVPNLNS